MTTDRLKYQELTQSRKKVIDFIVTLNFMSSFGNTRSKIKISWYVYSHVPAILNNDMDLCNFLFFNLKPMRYDISTSCALIIHTQDYRTSMGRIIFAERIAKVLMMRDHESITRTRQTADAIRSFV